jgi:hypothetical protein
MGRDMKIQLWSDVDQINDNAYSLPAMKLASFHKSMGDSVELFNDNYSCDLLYCSKIFSSEFTSDCPYTKHASKIIRGGTGYGISQDLPSEVEHIYPDYSLYPKLENTAVGFLTRGCPNNCSFCIVSGKEGLVSHKVADLSEFYKGQKEIILLDSNILACRDRTELLESLAGKKVKFQQGLDIRLMDNKAIDLLKNINITNWFFAWDLEKNSKRIKEGLLLWRGAYPEIRPMDISVYVLVNYNTTREFDIERCEWLFQNGFSPFVMIYERWKCDRWYKDLQRYYNNKHLLYSKHRVSLEQYIKNGGNFVDSQQPSFFD